jgi:glucose-1-phosphate adenylyltransferase
MGVYVFTWSKLREYLMRDAQDGKSSNDFGKNIIPLMLADGQGLYAYAFDGYWKDVGTIESLWEANMDLLRQPMPIDLYDKRWRIYARNPGMPPHYLAPGAQVVNTLMTEGCQVFGEVRSSVLFAGVQVEPGTLVTDAVVMPYATIARGAQVRRAIIAENAVIGPGCIIGEESGGIAVVGQGAVLPPGSVVKAGQQIDAETTTA